MSSRAVYHTDEHTSSKTDWTGLRPCLIHATPAHFGEDRSQAIIGVLMACAYVGTCLMPPLFGVMAQHPSTALLPFYLILLLVVMIAMHEQLNRKTAHTSP